MKSAGMIVHRHCRSTRRNGTAKLSLGVVMATVAWLQSQPVRADALAEPAQQPLEAPHARPQPSQSIADGTHAYALQHDGLTRRYLLHIPHSYDPSRPTPLVLAFHGGGGNARLMANDERYGLVSKAEEAGFIVVFPNGYSRYPGGRLATWNAGSCCGEARDRGIDDVGFVRAMYTRIRSQFNIDPGQVYATGMSNGGMLVHRLACDSADLFAAVAAVAGTDGTARCNPSRPVAILHIHAKDDDHVHFDGGAGTAAFRDRDKITEFVSVPQTMQRWRTRNGCDTSPMRTLSRPAAYCERYEGCTDGVQVQLCATDAGGHSWPGAAKVRRGKEAASRAIVANDLIWDFFKANAR